MFRVSLPARQARHRAFASSLAMALALAGGSAIGAIAASAPAHAQEDPEYSRDFVEAYEAANEHVSGKEGAEVEPVRALLPALKAAAQNNDERLAAGQMILNAGLALDDSTLQRDGIMLQLASGKLPAERAPLFNYYAGTLSWGMDDFENSRKYLIQAFDLGHEDDSLALLILESYVALDQPGEALAQLRRMLDSRPDAVTEDTLRRGVQIAYDGDMTGVLSDWTAAMVRQYPRAELWNIGINVLIDSYEFNAQESLDLYRLMARTDAMSNAREYIEYISTADARRMSNEVLPIVEEGIAKGLLDASDVFVEEALSVAGDRAATDRAEAPMLAEEARASDTGLSARAAADNFLSFGASAEAEEMYKLALEKGVEDRGRALMRLGIAQADQGKYDEARESFAQAEGNRAVVAAMWLAYLDVESGANVPAPAPAPAVPEPAPAQ